MEGTQPSCVGLLIACYLLPHFSFSFPIALRAELTSAEARLETERRGHQATKAAASSRERDLEEQLHAGSGALATMQHALEEAVARVHDAEQQAAVLAAENGQLKQQVRGKGAFVTRGGVVGQNRSRQVEQKVLLSAGKCHAVCAEVPY